MDQSIPKERTFESKLPADVRAMVRVIMKRAEFRSSETLNEKVDILRNSEFSIPVAYACKAVGISIKSYYKNIKLIAQGEPELDKTPPRQLLRIEEENIILDMILQAQLRSECMCGVDVREVASELYKKRT